MYTMTAPVINVTGRPPTQLRVMTRGNVVLRGSKDEQVVYKLVQRMKARYPGRRSPYVRVGRRSGGHSAHQYD